QVFRPLWGRRDACGPRGEEVAMTVFDLAALVLENLARRKGRVVLTAVGVIIGTAAVVLLVSLGVGLQQNAASQLGGIGDLTKIQVYPFYGEPDPNTGAPSSSTPLTDDTVAQLQALEGVAAVIPQDYLQSWGFLTVGRVQGGGQFIGVGTDDLTNLGVRAQAGSLAVARGGLVVGSAIPQSFFDPFAPPADGPPEPIDLLDKQVTLTLVKWASDGTEVRKTIRTRVTGIIAETRDEPDWSVYLPLDELSGYNAWVSGQPIDRSKVGYPQLVVRATSVETVLDVTEQISALGYQAYTPQSFVQGINGFYTVLQIIFGGVGAIALLVAAIGIANTMTMAILERTREIGLMKAVGATNRHVLAVFLGESAGIGFLGGLGGVTLGWGLGQVANVFVLAYLAGQSVETGAPPPSVAVSTPLWLPLFALLFATLVGLLSGLYPALSAATLSPMRALKYE
ncbi:MAG: ABC transporter permease, partial [Anaerolineales bacterium]|nr:ABC transporter permease [Anaerolineales bacterium]